MSDILLRLSRLASQEIDEALHGDRLDASRTKLLCQIQVPCHVLISANQVGRPSPNGRLQNDIIVRVAAESEVTTYQHQADDCACTRYKSINVLRSYLTYLHKYTVN